MPIRRKGEHDESLLIYELDYPKPIKEIPALVKGLPDNVEFEAATKTVEAVMAYL